MYLLEMSQGSLYLLFTEGHNLTAHNHRMILNLKKLKGSVKYEHLKMDTLWTVIRMMKPNCYMASIDIKDAYYSVPIAETDQKYRKIPKISPSKYKPPKPVTQKTLR